MFGYRKRALAAEARVKELEAELARQKERADHYFKIWMDGPVQDALGRRDPQPIDRVSQLNRQRCQQESKAEPAMAVASASSYTGGGFDMTSALLGGLAGYAVGSSGHSHSESNSCRASDDSSSFGSGGGGDYGGGGASSSWDSSSSSSDSSSYSSGDSGSSFSSSD